MKSTDSVEAWNENAPYWVKHAETIRTMFAPVTIALIEQAQIHPGQSVLDVACGTGEPALTISRQVGSSGSVTCTDAVLEMVKATEARARDRGLDNVSFRHCPAESLPFPDNSFDVAESRLGVMLFGDPAVAVKEMLRVIKPGGIVAFVVWGENDLNPFTSLPSKVMSRHFPTPPADPDAPTAFRFAAPGKLAGVLTGAGSINVHERTFEFRIEAPISAPEFWNMRSVTSGSIRQQLETLPEVEVQQIAAEIEQSVREFFPNDQMSFPGVMLIVTGSVP
jgi:SAM-dependent methyltransferase